MSKADRLGNSAAFTAVQHPRSARRRLVEQATGDAPADPSHVPVEELVGNPDNTREVLGDVEELAESLRLHGVRQPLSVMSRKAFLEVHPEHEEALGEGRWVVVNGNRRLAAAQAAGLSSLPVHLDSGQGADKASIRIAVLAENIHRKDLEPLEEAKAVRDLVEMCGGNNAEAARRLGKSRVWVGQRLALLELIPDLQEALRGGRLKIKDARRLGTLAADEQQEEWERIVNPVYTNREAPSGEGRPSEDVNPVYIDGEAPSGNAPLDKGVNPVYTPPLKRPTRHPVSATDGVNHNGRPPGGPIQLTLDFTGEPAELVDRLIEELGQERCTTLLKALEAARERFDLS